MYSYFWRRQNLPKIILDRETQELIATVAFLARPMLGHVSNNQPVLLNYALYITVFATNGVFLADPFCPLNCTVAGTFPSPKRNLWLKKYCHLGKLDILLQSDLIKILSEVRLRLNYMTVSWSLQQLNTWSRGIIGKQTHTQSNAQKNAMNPPACAMGISCHMPCRDL